MGSRFFAPGPQERRFAAYVDGLQTAAGHEDRHAPLRDHCKGLLLPVNGRASSRWRHDSTHTTFRATRQSLQRLVAKAPWSDQALLDQVRRQVLPAMQKHGPVVAWIGDDTGFPKKGRHSVGVIRQYCG